MAEVMSTAEDLNINIYYTDTDSFFIDKSKIALLNENYEEKYHRVLEGKE